MSRIKQFAKSLALVSLGAIGVYSFNNLEKITGYIVEKTELLDDMARASKMSEQISEQYLTPEEETTEYRNIYMQKNGKFGIDKDYVRKFMERDTSKKLYILALDSDQDGTIDIAFQSEDTIAHFHGNMLADEKERREILGW